MNCDIIRDLLPLYVDEVCSEASKNTVDEHLQTCESCRKELELMRGAVSEVIAEEVDSAQAAGKAWKKSRLRAVLLGILAAAVLFGAGYGLFVPNIVPVDERYLQVNDVIYHYEDGAIAVKLTILDGKKHSFIRYRQEGEAFYITPMRPIIATREDPDWVERKNSGTHNIGGAVVGELKEMYVGWGDNAILVWSRDQLDEDEFELTRRLEELLREQDE